MSTIVFAATFFVLASQLATGYGTPDFLVPAIVTQSEGDTYECAAHDDHKIVDTFVQMARLCNLQGSSPELAIDSCGGLGWQSSRVRSYCPSGTYYVRNSTGAVVPVFCESGDVFPPNLNVTTSGWMRVADLNITDPDQQCPESWFLNVTNSVRACRVATLSDSYSYYYTSCDSAIFAVYGVQYQTVCGRVRGYQVGSSDGFLGTDYFEDYYVDGISITHGYPRQHVWTYAAGFECPCNGTGRLPPDVVGSDYYCETGVSSLNWANIVYLDDPLWDGQGCDNDDAGRACCDQSPRPWFCKKLPEPTTDDLEVRLCTLWNEDVRVLIDLVELYVQ